MLSHGSQHRGLASAAAAAAAAAASRGRGGIGGHDLRAMKVLYVKYTKGEEAFFLVVLTSPLLLYSPGPLFTVFLQL